MRRIEKLLGGKDNVVRAAELVTVDNSLRKIRTKRQVQELCPLEVDTSVEDTPTPFMRTIQSASDTSVQMLRN